MIKVKEFCTLSKKDFEELKQLHRLCLPEANYSEKYYKDKKKKALDCPD
ncbi:MAG TPA: hypothetical protein VKP03_01205 [Patescibacteria group bacterium]|nr:hypothetical protein [Patescibacteria group bacterium]